MGANEITKEYFLQEYNDFRQIMCSGSITQENKLEAYKGLWFVYLNLKLDLPDTDTKLCQGAMEALDVEFNMRIGLQFQMDVEAYTRAQMIAAQI